MTQVNKGCYIVDTQLSTTDKGKPIKRVTVTNSTFYPIGGRDEVGAFLLDPGETRDGNPVFNCKDKNNLLSKASMQDNILARKKIVSLNKLLSPDTDPDTRLQINSAISEYNDIIGLTAMAANKAAFAAAESADLQSRKHR